MDEEAGSLFWMVHSRGWAPRFGKRAGPRSMWELARREHESMNSRVRGVCLTFCFEEGEGAFCRCSVVERPCLEVERDESVMTLCVRVNVDSCRAMARA